jgi:hypothetical protein
VRCSELAATNVQLSHTRSLAATCSPRCQQRRRDREAEGLGGLEVDDQLKLRGLFNRKVTGLGALEDLVYIDANPSKEIREVRAMCQKPSGVSAFSVLGLSAEVGAEIAGKQFRSVRLWSPA